jgi:L-iditol 2-dehydrogenase
MKAAVYHGQNSISVEERAVPIISDGEILLEVKAVGVCPTDVKAYYNGSGSIQSPRILGHEVTGIIRESRSSNFAVGERVNVAADNPCMKCDRCIRGLHNMCRNITSLGINIDGGYAEFMRVPKEFIDNGMVIRLKDSTSFVEGTFIEPVAVSLNALSLAHPEGSRQAIVIGDGPNALIHLQLLKRYYGVKKVVVTGMIPYRLKLARNLDADDIVDVKNEPKGIDSLGKDFDIVDITIGNSQALDQALTLTDAGTRIVVFGGSIKDTSIPITMNKVHYNQITVTGSTGTSLSHYAEAADIVNTGRLDLKSLVTESFAVDKIIEAFAYSKEMKGVKGAVVF